MFTVLTVVLALGILATVVVTWRTQLDAVDDRLDNTLRETALVIELLDPEERVEIQAIGRNVAWAVFAPDGRSLLFSPAGRPNDPLGSPDVSADRIVNDIGERFSVDGLDGGPRYRVGSVRLDSGNVLMVAQPLDAIDETISNLIVTMIAGGLVVLAVLGVLFWLIMRAGLRPLEEMIDTASTIAAGDYGRRAELPDTTDEVHTLATALNTMLDTIETSLAERDATQLRLRQFVSDASHELRTPLTTIRGYSELYLSGADTDADAVDKQMTRINSEATRMAALVEDLLTLARLDQGRGLERNHVDLNQITKDGVNDAQATDPNRTYLLDGCEATVLGDDARLRQVLGNLLANARAHTPEGTTVTVSMSVEDDVVTIAVADNGPGMDPETAAHVFDRFYTAESSRNRSSGGSGLGLSITSSIVTAHGGGIDLETSPGHGATFRVLLPSRMSLQPEEWAARPAWSGRDEG